MIDPCILDITLEFLSVAFHSILYYASVYPKSIFETRKKYNIIVYRSVHPQVNEYIDTTLKKIEQCFIDDRLDCVQFAVLDANFKTIFTYVFQFGNLSDPNEPIDPYLVQCEMNLRAFCLKLSSLKCFFNDMPQSSSFSINIHTNDDAPLEVDSNFEVFPVEEHYETRVENNKVVPIKTLRIKNHSVESVLEFE